MKKFNRQIIFFHFFILPVSMMLSSCAGNTTFNTLSGSEIRLNDSLAVFVFLDNRCPICRRYQGELKLLNKEKPATPVYYVFCGKQPQQEIQDFCSYDGISGSQVILDRNYVLAKQMQATVTPQVVIKRDGKTLYTGKIDDRYENIASQRAGARINYVNNALFSLARNEDIRIKHTEPVGCFIELR